METFSENKIAKRPLRRATVAVLRLADGLKTPFRRSKLLQCRLCRLGLFLLFFLALSAKSDVMMFSYQQSLSELSFPTSEQ